MANAGVLFTKADIPVFQMSIHYHASPDYHFEIGKQLKTLRDKGVLILGSGSLIHNLQLVRQRFVTVDMSPFGWEAEYDYWIKDKIDRRDFSSIIDYTTSHKLGKLAAHTPDHFVPVLYSLGLMDSDDEVKHFYEGGAKLP